MRTPRNFDSQRGLLVHLSKPEKALGLIGAVATISLTIAGATYGAGATMGGVNARLDNEAVTVSDQEKRIRDLEALRQMIAKQGQQLEDQGRELHELHELWIPGGAKR